MCIICAAIPATVGAKLNADQIRKPEEKRLSIPKITGILIGVLVVASAVYHMLRGRLN